MQYSYFSEGGVYNLTDQQKNNVMYLVVSVNQFNSAGQVVVVPLRLSPVDMNEKKDIILTVNCGDSLEKWKLYPEQLFSMRASRLTNYRFSITKDLMIKVKESLMNVLFGEVLYTKQQAFYEATLKGIKNSLDIEKEELPEMELSLEEEQERFAEEQKKREKRTKCVYLEQEKQTDQESQQESIEQYKPRITCGGRYKMSRDYMKEFLDNSMEFSAKEMALLYEIAEAGVRSRIKYYRKTLQKEGEDVTKWRKR